MSRIYLALSLFIYILFLVFGYLAGLNSIDSVEIALSINDNRLQFTKILFNNLHLIFVLLLGSVNLGFSTFLNLALNGLSFGSNLKYFSSLFNAPTLAALVLPHAIFEVPAIIIAGAAGFKIPYEIILYLAGRKEQVLTKEDIKEYLTLAAISIILIVIAAWIEANITLKIAKAMLNASG